MIDLLMISGLVLCDAGALDGAKDGGNWQGVKPRSTVMVATNVSYQRVLC